MSLQQTETVDLGEIKVSNQKTTVFVVPNVGTGVVVAIYDMENGVGGLAHVVLPESALSTSYTDSTPAKYADKAIPLLVQAFLDAGGRKRSCLVRMVGGAQLFNFGGGSGNILNIGARNATAIQTALSKQGLVIEKSDTGGNKGKSLKFILATGKLHVQQIGGTEYDL